MSVGFRLYREILNFAPQDWTSGELVVALVIADDAKDETRASWIGLADLCYRARLKPSSVRAALARLASRGYEFRVPHGHGKDGRPVFAARGHATDYAVPDMLKAAATLAPMAGKGADALAPMTAGNGQIGADAVAAIAGKGADTLAPKPVDNPAKGADALAPTGGQRDEKGASETAKGADRLAAIGEKGANASAPLPSEDLNPQTTLTTQVAVVTPPVEGTLTRAERAAWEAVMARRQPGA